MIIGPVCLWVCGCVCLWVCYHDNSKLRALILTKHLQLIKFRPSRAPVTGSAAGRKFSAPPYYSQLAVFASLWALFFHYYYYYYYYYKKY